jgi:hypothetical protein
MKLKSQIKAHPLCVGYVAVASFLGVLLQGWVPGL